MTATSVTFSPKVASDWDPQKPLTTTKLNQLYDNTTNLHERLGGSYSSNTKDHTHDGVDSARVQVGSNMLRNGDFEGGMTGWTVSNYTNGSVAASTLDADGTAAVQITSTVLANGGGDILSNEFMVCVGGAPYSWSCNNWVAASVANLSSKLEAVFYDATQAHISDSVLFSYNSTPIANTRVSGTVMVPATARYMKIRATGGIPATPVGGNVGTVYFDAIQVTFRPGQPVVGSSAHAMIITGLPLPSGYTNRTPYDVFIASGSLGYKEMANARINTSGDYNVTYTQAGNYAQLYKNGVAYGPVHNSGPCTDTVTVKAGDTVQIFTQPYNNGQSDGVANVTISIASTTIEGVIPPSSLLIGAR